MDTFVPQQTIKELTKRQKFSAQFRVLSKMGFVVIKAPTGEPKVTWANFHRVTGGYVQSFSDPEVILNPDAI